MEEQNIDGTTPTISSLPEFAQIYAFLQLFGTSLQLPPVTLRELEDFFSHGKITETCMKDYCVCFFQCQLQLEHITIYLWYRRPLTYYITCEQGTGMSQVRTAWSTFTGGWSVRS